MQARVRSLAYGAAFSLVWGHGDRRVHRVTVHASRAFPSHACGIAWHVLCRFFAPTSNRPYHRVGSRRELVLFSCYFCQIRCSKGIKPPVCETGHGHSGVGPWLGGPWLGGPWLGGPSRVVSTLQEDKQAVCSGGGEQNRLLEVRGSQSHEMMSPAPPATDRGVIDQCQVGVWLLGFSLC